MSQVGARTGTQSLSKALTYPATVTVGSLNPDWQTHVFVDSYQVLNLPKHWQLVKFALLVEPVPHTIHVNDAKLLDADP